MDGFELARHLRSNADLPPIRLVAVTGYGQDHDRGRTHAAGFDAPLVKPVGLQALVGLIENLLDHARQVESRLRLAFASFARGFVSRVLQLFSVLLDIIASPLGGLTIARS